MIMEAAFTNVHSELSRSAFCLTPLEIFWQLEGLQSRCKALQTYGGSFRSAVVKFALTNPRLKLTCYQMKMLSLEILIPRDNAHVCCMP